MTPPHVHVAQGFWRTGDFVDWVQGPLERAGLARSMFSAAVRA